MDTVKKIFKTAMKIIVYLVLLALGVGMVYGMILEPDRWFHYGLKLMAIGGGLVYFYEATHDKSPDI